MLNVIAFYKLEFQSVFDRDEDPVLAKTRILGSVPQTKRDFFYWMKF